MDHNFANEEGYVEKHIGELYGHLPNKWKQESLSRPKTLKPKETVFWGKGDKKIDIDKMTDTHLRHALKFVITNKLIEREKTDINPEVLAVLREAEDQIRYLHTKFQETGSGNSVLAKIKSIINRVT